MIGKTNKCKRKLGLFLAAIMCMCMLTGCASNADTLSSPGPSLNSTEMPGNQLKEDVKEMLPGTSPGNTASPTENVPASGSGIPDTLEKSRQVSDDMENAIDMLTEIDDVDVVAIGNQALIGIEFTAQYQGGLDDRIREMIMTRIQTVSKGVDELYISDNNDIREQIDQLSDRLEHASSLSDVTDAFAAFTHKIDVYKK